MKKLLTTISILLIATASYAHGEAVPEGGTYTVERVVDGDTVGETVRFDLVKGRVSAVVKLEKVFDLKPLKLPFNVERVIDGDTIVVTSPKGGKSEKMRLIGIVTPESKPNDKAKRDSERTGQDLEIINKMGQDATKFLEELIVEGDKVRLQYGVQSKDKYGRWLVYAYYLVCLDMCKYEAVAGQHYETLGDGIYMNLNATIIKSGYATPMTTPPNVKYADLFKELYEEARESKRGLWKDDVTSSVQLTPRVIDEAKKISASKFKEQYELGRMQTMKYTEYLGNKDGKAFLKIKTMSIINPKKWSEKIVYVELSDLDERFKASLP